MLNKELNLQGSVQALLAPTCVFVVIYMPLDVYNEGCCYQRNTAEAHTKPRADSDPVIIPKKVVNVRLFFTLYGIITGSMSANY